MKSLKLITILPALLAFAYAQPTLTPANVPQNGDVVVRRHLDMQSITLGSPGANITWDYSGAVFSTNRDSGQYVAAVPPQPSIWNYNQAYHFNRHYGTSGQSLNLYDYFITTQDSYSRAGMDHGIPDLHPFEFRNAAPLLRFPMTYGTSFSDSMAGQHQSIAGPMSFKGITHVEADGYGTLILPDTTWTNVLRVHTLDSVVESGSPFLYSSCYYFYHPTSRHPLLLHCPGDLMQPYAWILSQPSILNALEGRIEREVQTGPSPARDFIWVEMTGMGQKATIRLVNLKGQSTLEQKISGKGKIPVQNLEPGLYLMEITLPGGERSCRKQLIFH